MALQVLHNYKDYQTAYSTFIHSYGQVLPIEYTISTNNDLVNSFSFKVPNKYSVVYEKQNQEFNTFLNDIVTKRRFRDSMSHQLGFIEVIERIYDVTDLLSQNHIRLKIILAEFERIQEHLIWFYELLNNAGIPYYNVIKQLINQITKILEHFFKIKNANLSSCIEMGKINITFSESDNYNLQSLLIDIIDDYDELKDFLITNWQVRNILFTVGLMDTAVCVRSGTVGPIARASAIDQDLRIDDPYFDYLGLGDFKLAQSYDQDLYGLLKVLITEISVSFEIIQTILRNDFRIQPDNVLKEVDLDQSGEMIARLETSKGPTLYSLNCQAHMQVTGFGMSTPGLANLYSLETRLKGVPVNHISRIIHAYNITDLSILKT